LFLELCKYQGLNPFVREVYLVKYGGKASMVTGKEVFTKRAMNNPMYAGMKAGITIQKKDGTVERREGSLCFSGETLVGGWASVYIKGYTVPMFDEVAFLEYAGIKDGRPFGMWASKPATMIRKVAIVHALREAFPKEFEGLYSQEEINTVDINKLPTEPVKLVESTSVPEANDVTTPEANDVTTPEAASYVEPVSTPKAKVSDDDFVIPLGKHKGSTLLHTYETDKSWLEWFISWDKARDPALSSIRNYLNAHANVNQVAMPDDDNSGYQIPSDDDMPFDLGSLKR
jgi:phage recombination protein Bet